MMFMKRVEPRGGLNPRNRLKQRAETALLTCRRARGKKHMVIGTLLAMLLSTMGGPTVPVKAQLNPIGQGFTITAEDLAFILQQIRIGQEHAAGNALFGPGPLQVGEPRFAFGLRTVDGSFNNVIPGQTHFGAADTVFPRMTPPSFPTVVAPGPGSILLR